MHFVKFLVDTPGVLRGCMVPPGGQISTFREIRQKRWKSTWESFYMNFPQFLFDTPGGTEGVQGTPWGSNFDFSGNSPKTMEINLGIVLDTFPVIFVRHPRGYMVSVQPKVNHTFRSPFSYFYCSVSKTNKM